MSSTLITSSHFAQLEAEQEARLSAEREKSLMQDELEELTAQLFTEASDQVLKARLDLESYKQENNRLKMKMEELNGCIIELRDLNDKQKMELSLLKSELRSHLSAAGSGGEPPVDLVMEPINSPSRMKNSIPFFRDLKLTNITSTQLSHLHLLVQDELEITLRLPVLRNNIRSLRRHLTSIMDGTIIVETVQTASNVDIDDIIIDQQQLQPYEGVLSWISSLFTGNSCSSSTACQLCQVDGCEMLVQINLKDRKKYYRYRLSDSDYRWKLVCFKCYNCLVVCADLAHFIRLLRMEMFKQCDESKVHDRLVALLENLYHVRFMIHA